MTDLSRCSNPIRLLLSSSRIVAVWSLNESIEEGLSTNNCCLRVLRSGSSASIAAFSSIREANTRFGFDRRVFLHSRSEHTLRIGRSALHQRKALCSYPWADRREWSRDRATKLGVWRLDRAAETKWLCRICPRWRDRGLSGVRFGFWIGRGSFPCREETDCKALTRRRSFCTHRKWAGWSERNKQTEKALVLAAGASSAKSPKTASKPQLRPLHHHTKTLLSHPLHSQNASDWFPWIAAKKTRSSSIKTRSKKHLNALISPRVVDFDAVRRGYDEVGTEIHSVGGIAGPFQMLAFLHSLE